ncbi:MAG: malonyl-CoA decarboxylase [Rhodospirillaceae bacterium]
MKHHFLHDLLNAITDRGRELLDRAISGGDKSDPWAAVDSLLSSRGEASGVALARQIIDIFEAMDDAGRQAFFERLAADYGPDKDRVKAAIDAFAKDSSDHKALELHEAAEARRQELFRRINSGPGGTATLVDMREDLLGRLKDAPQLKAVDADFQHLLSSWFNRGFLVMRQIGWSTPANILEKIIKYEAVHAIDDWDDLRRRTDPPDRRCYGFFHPALVDEPLIFVEVALTREIPDAIGPILEDGREPIQPHDATTAVFYSISNCQSGLRGVSFGNFLIKQVVEELRRELPNLTTFVTLSPVPGFVRWLETENETEDEGFVWSAINEAGWQDNEYKRDKVAAALPQIAARYFLKAKRPDGQPVDSVARFHLGNGARLERINVMADLSKRGLKQAAALMVNYLYDPDKIEKNHEMFVNEGKIVASDAVRKLLK